LSRLKLMLIKKVLIDKANRLYQLPPDIMAFAESDRQRAFHRRADLIDLASFRWPVEFDEDQLPNREGLLPADRERTNQLKEELAAWLARQFGTRTVATREIFVGGSISTLVYQMALAYIDSGDIAFVPSLGIPLYRKVVTACNGEPVSYSISAKNDWMPRFDRLNSRLGRVARLLFLNSPHNPTGAELSEKEMTELAWLAGRENILLVNDAAYAAIPSRQPVSLLSIRGGRKVGVELYSFSYQFGLPPLPFGFAVGSREAVNGLQAAARLIPAPIPRFYVDLALRALRKYPGRHLRHVRSTVTKATAETNHLLDLLKLETAGTSSVPYLWAKIARRGLAVNLARLLFKRYRILVAPGPSFGENGEGYVRFCLTAGADAFAKAAARIRKRKVLTPKGKGEE
jgi:aspartate/methionine/tyrosine aminotransferase